MPYPSAAVRGKNFGSVVLYTISGTVYDADGATAVSGATVALGAKSATSAANGTYTITGLAPGTSGSMTCTKTGYSWAAITVAAMTGNLTTQNYSNAWWAAGGCAASCVAAYRAIGAATLAASYVNLANPGTNDAAPGDAPTFNTATGWTFDGSNDYLTTGIIPANTNISILARFVGAASQSGYIFGCSDGTNVLGIYPAFNNDDSMDVYNAGSYRISIADGLTSGVIGLAGKTAYLNGASKGTIGAGTYGTLVQVYIGARNNAGTPGTKFNKTIAAIAFYNSVITSQVAAVSAAMAALP